jgi:alkanesulfonate monooxygenase SsuD/methylene tetrahydromethanopterin reductase-like flavin-dependent oxidoreductase (luciferase family)
LVSLGFLVGRTQRLELGVSALVVAQRQPLVALKQLTTLDFLSGGRIVTAVTAGWMEGEFASLGASYAGRGQLLDEWLRVASSVFGQMPGRVRHEGRLMSLDGWMAPPLVRPGGPELWVAGVSRATLRRAELTGVWHPVALPPDELRALAAELRERRPDSRVILRIGVYFAPEPRAGVDERGRHAIAGPPEWIAERLREYQDAGCTGFVLNLSHASAGLEERIQRFAEEVAPLLRTSDLSRAKSDEQGADPGVNPVDKPDSGDGG